MVKACLILWADSVGTDELHNDRYRAAIDFVCNGVRDSKPLVSLDGRPLPDRFGDFGDNPNLIWVGSDVDGRVVGYFRMLGAIGWSFELAEHGGPTNRQFILVANPMSPAQWECKPDAEELLEFKWVSYAAFDQHFTDVTEALSKLMKRARDESLENTLQQVVEDAFQAAGVTDGEVISSEQFEKIVQSIAFETAHIALRLPYKKPVI